MKNTDFSNSTQFLLQEIKEIIEKKGIEYQSNDDVLSNFKDNAKDLGLTKYQIWSVYFTKHTKSIISQIKKNPKNPSDNDSVESTRSRIHDAIAYLLFLNAMLEEDRS